jgi:hypothetical protein
MTKSRDETVTKEPVVERRAALKKLGRFAVITAPAVTLILAAGTRPAAAPPCSPCSSSRAFKTSEGAVDVSALLGSLRHMPVAVGAPRPEDVRAACGIGNGTSIHPLDAAGICLGAIQALAARIGALETAMA